MYFVASRLTRSSCFRWSGGQPDEPAAADGLHRGRGTADFLRHLRRRRPAAPAQDAHHPQGPEGDALSRLMGWTAARAPRARRDSCVLCVDRWRTSSCTTRATMCCATSAAPPTSSRVRRLREWPLWRRRSKSLWLFFCT